MTLLCVVPVLARTGRHDGVPVAAVRLRELPLYVHAARTVRDAVDAELVVVAPASSVRAVVAGLGAGGLADVPVVADGGGLGAVLAGLLLLPGAWADPGATVLVHDPRCPLTPPSCLRDAVEAARRDPAAVVVAARGMTDTVKEFVDGVVLGTVDRERLRVVASPLLLPAVLLRALRDQGVLAGCVDVDDLLQAVRATGARLVWTPAPARARRVGDAASVAVLECLSDVG